VKIEPLDAITLEVWWSRLVAIADEAATTLLRTAFSTIIRESNDYTVVLMNAPGQTIAECNAGIPGFAALMSGLTRHLLAKFPAESWRDGDVVITNDPWIATAIYLACQPAVGRAVTARMVAREPGEDGIPVSFLHQAIAETEGPVAVVLEDCDDPAGAGAFLGEVNGSLLAALRVRGVITNGRVRDAGELRGFPYAVYAAGLCVARSYMRLTGVGTEVTVAGLTVHPGDLLHADEHGVLQIPAEALPGIIEKAEVIREDEQKVVGWSRSADFSVEKLLQLRRVRH
jgi:regulator of RNase E activity RraA